MYGLNLPELETITDALLDDSYTDIPEPKTREDVVDFLRTYFPDIDNEGRICLISPVKETGGWR